MKVQRVGQRGFKGRRTDQSAEVTGLKGHVVNRDLLGEGYACPRVHGTWMWRFRNWVSMHFLSCLPGPAEHHCQAVACFLRGYPSVHKINVHCCVEQ